jgi:hypothetical protein
MSSFPWNKEEPAARKGRKVLQNHSSGSNIFGSEQAVSRPKKVLQPKYNIISGNGSTSNAVDRQPKKSVWNPADYHVVKGSGAMATAGENPFEQNANTKNTSRFSRQPKCGDFNYQESNSAYKNGMANAKALKVSSQTSGAGACIFGN